MEARIEHGKTKWATDMRDKFVPLLSEELVMKVGKKCAGFRER
jgi:hypothetical protein